MSRPSKPNSSARRHTSRLPARANLEHLRNEAKQLLKDTRRAQPEATLAAAQLEVARRYGFASWRRLKSFVDALSDEGVRLIQAVRAGDLSTMREVLDLWPELVNAATDQDPHIIRPSDALAMRLMHLAVAENQTGAARLLIEWGADLNVRNADGRLALHDSFEVGTEEMTALLLEAGAEPDVCAAAAFGLRDRLRELLARDPEQANDLRTGMSPVGWCSYGNQPECAEMLIESGAILDRPPYDVQAWAPATHVANTNLARVLLAHGASPNCQNANGDSPIHAAIKSRLLVDPGAFVELLLSAGADRALRNRDGRTALDEARRQLGTVAQTYFPVRPIGAKRLDRVIALLS